MGHADPHPTASSTVISEPIPPALAGSPDYEVVREISRGGMGVVYLARNRRMDRLEALKVVMPALLERDGALERFEREMRAAARLNHPNIVAAYSSPPLPGLLAFAMEYVDGVDLRQLVALRGRLPVSNACYYIHQAAQGLQHAHDRKMVHRDIKPGNLMLTRDGKRHVLKILDFGLAKASSENPIDAGLTGAGQMLGTPSYMAPEQIVNATTADIRADIYSLGCTLYHLLAGEPPFQKKGSIFEILEAHRSETARSLHEVRPDVPGELAGIVARMLHKDPAQRYQQPSELAKALAPFFQHGVKPIPTGSTHFAVPSVADAAPETADFKASEATRLPNAAPIPAGATRTNSPPDKVPDRIPDEGPGNESAAGVAILNPRQQALRLKLWVGLAAGVLLLGLIGLGTRSVFIKSQTSDETATSQGAERDRSPSVVAEDPPPATGRGPLAAEQDRPQPPADVSSQTAAAGASISEPQEPSSAESGAVAEQADIDSGAVPVVAKLADDSDHPELPPEQTRPADAPARDLLKAARVKYANDAKRAEKALTGQFDREIELLARAKMKPDERVHLVQALQEEKRAFEAHGRIPWSWPMRSAVLTYMRELMTADATLTKVYDRHIASAIRGKDDSLVASLRQDLKSAVPRRLLATWKCTGVTFKAAWRLELYSDGTTNRGDRSPGPGDEWIWALDARLLVVKWRNASDPRVQSVDRCLLSIDGSAFTAENNKKDRFAGKLVRSGD